MNDTLENAQPRNPTRREFTKSLATASLVTITTTLISATGCAEKPLPTKLIAQTDDLPIGGSKVFAYPTDECPCFLLRPAADTYLAFSRLCTHHSCPVFYRSEDNEFDCPCHGGVFSAANGSVLAGPPPQPLPQIKLELRGPQIFAVGIVQTQKA
jgi:arsenite oxidase small subunit